MAINNVKLRQVVESGLTTLNRELTFTEADTNWVEIVRAILALNSSSTIATYSAVAEYTQPDFVSYSGNIYRFIFATPRTGVTPGTDAAVWELSSVGALSHPAAALTAANAGLTLNPATQRFEFRQAMGLLQLLILPSGTDNLIGSPEPTLKGDYFTGQFFILKPAATNTGAVTINLSNLGAVAITKEVNTPLVGGDLIANKLYIIAYNGTAFQIIGGGGGGGGSSVWGGITGTLTDQGDLVSELATKVNKLDDEYELAIIQSMKLMTGN